MPRRKNGLRMLRQSASSDLTVIAVPAPMMDEGKEIREWWTRQKLGEMTDEVTLTQALADVGMLSLAHLARRLSSQETPEVVRDQIALAMGPKLAVEVRGRLSQQRPTDASMGSIFNAYRIRQ